MGRTKGIPKRRISPERALPPNAEGGSEGRSLSGLLKGIGNFELPTVEEIPDDLINFMGQDENSYHEGPRKRLKTKHGSREAGEEIVQADHSINEYIVVKQSSLEIKCTGSKLSADTVLTKVNVQFRQDDHSVTVLDGAGKPLLIVPYSKCHMYSFGGSVLEDIYTALAVDRDSKKWRSNQGKLWTQLDILLFQKNNLDHIQLVFTMKWNATASPEFVSLKKKTISFSKVLDIYFPDPNVTNPETFSPQDFYGCVYSTKQDDETSSSIETDLVSSLYPFQKRAVQWLLLREGVTWSAATKNVVSGQPTQTSHLPISFRATMDAQGRPCYVSHLFGVVTFNLDPFLEMEQRLQGGILAEEMGLGKTVEMIALMSLHQRPSHGSSVFDPYSGENVQSTNATLIISPPSISKQWIAEINRHAPHFKVTYYQGIKNEKAGHTEIMDQFASSDVVITTYSVLAAEINFTKLNPEKTLRKESKYPRRKSPLMQFSWWRVCLDEAQMVESGVSKAATVARMIPRINAWAITGTPVRKNVNDLLGLLIFLRYEPYASSQHIFLSLVSSHKADFRNIFGTIALRHSKMSVREELKLPQQRRFVITMPFTPIEEQYYQELFDQMCEESGVNAEGSPLIDDWNPQDYTDIMRRWLVRLRQTALHPEVGGRNRRALGVNKDVPLRTVHQVLDVMMEQTDLAIRTDHRALLISKLKRGQLYENSPRVKEALEIWEAVVVESSKLVHDCREQLRIELEKSTGANPSTPSQHSEPDANPEEEVDPTSSVGKLRTRLRGALEIEHMAIFFRANAHFQIKSNEEMTKPDSVEFLTLDKLETEGYEAAKTLRREILQDVYNNANTLMQTIAERANGQKFIQIPEFPPSAPMIGLESRRIIDELDTLGINLDDQANQIDEWREHLIQILLRPLVDEDDGLEVNGDEYEESTKLQDEVMVYVQVLRAMVADRHTSLTGVHNALAIQEAKSAIREAKAGNGAYPEKLLELFRTRELHTHKGQKTLREIASELRTVASNLRSDAGNGSVRAQTELSIIESQLNIQKHLTEQIKVTAALDKEMELFTSIMNARLEYYRQLQAISDGLAPYEGPNNERVLEKMAQDEERLVRKLATTKSKRRYLVHLKQEAANPEEQRLCVICRDGFEVGALTVCGHQYCHDCIKFWWSTHHNCPVCKKKLTRNDLHEITYKPQELSIQAEEIQEPVQNAHPPSSGSQRKSGIYSDVSKVTLDQIKNIELPGNVSFGTKIDTLARHLLYLRESDPGAKSIVYSQFRDFLSVLSQAFQRYRIGFSSIDKPDGIEKFKNDAGTEVFLLHAKAHSAGLTLVNASHVFLCEPLLNTALELQAIARVDRIGQKVGTNVWLYLVSDTVEESIHELSVKRRMEHLGHAIGSGKGKGKELTEDELVDGGLEQANSMEMQEVKLGELLTKGTSGGEVVGEGDLWDCLFGGRAKRNLTNIGSSQVMEDQVVRRHLMAEAGEQRNGA